MNRFVILPLGAALGLMTGAAEAQSIGGSTPTIGSMFSRNRSVTVSERMIPGYDRLGINTGIFNIKPQVLAAAFYTDNLYATEDNSRSDVALTLTPTVNAVAESGPTQVTLGANAQFSRYLSRDTENNTIYTTRAVVRHDLGAGFTVSASGGYLRQAERRSDPGAINTSITPILFNIAEIGGAVEWEGARVRVQGLGSYRNIDFRNGRLLDGTPLSQRYRDRDVYRTALTADYALTADLALRAQVDYTKNDYKPPIEVGRLDRSSRRIEVLGGASFEFTDLLRGEFGIGYINQTFEAPAFKSISGVGGRAQLEYLPTPLTTFTLRASRTIDEAGTPNAPSYLRTAASLQVDHELYRNLIVSAYGGYSANRFRLPTRMDKRPTFGASAMYRMSRNLTLIARYDHLDVSGSPDALQRDLKLNTASIGIDIGL